MTTDKIYIIKASGQRELFSEKKVYGSARRAGASRKLAEEIVEEIREQIYPDIPSQKIFDYIVSYLAKTRKEDIAGRYSLKNAIMELGPSGFPFEKYIGMILREYGYETRTNQMVKGHCLTHEVDIVAQKENKYFMVECKHHHRAGLRSDSKVALYTYARFLDIKKGWEEKLGQTHQFYGAMLVTNTKCTSNAIRFVNCSGMEIISWRYPRGRGLETLIEDKKLYPITSLRSAGRSVKNKLIANDVILARDLLDADINSLSQRAEISLNKLQHLRNEARSICQSREN